MSLEFENLSKPYTPTREALIGLIKNSSLVISLANAGLLFTGDEPIRREPSDTIADSMTSLRVALDLAKKHGIELPENLLVAAHTLEAKFDFEARIRLGIK